MGQPNLNLIDFIPDSSHFAHEDVRLNTTHSSTPTSIALPPYIISHNLTHPNITLLILISLSTPFHIPLLPTPNHLLRNPTHRNPPPRQLPRRLTNLGLPPRHLPSNHQTILFRR